MSEPTNLESQSDLKPDLAGYPSTEALVQGYRASGDEAKKQRERAERAESQLQAMLQGANHRPDVVQRPTDPYQQLGEYGIPPDALRAAVQAEAAAVIRNELAPLARGFQARNDILGQYPDYNKFESDVAQFINSDPQMSQKYENLFRADPAGAMEYAFLKFGESRRRSHTPNGSGAVEGAAHAQIPNARGAGESRQNGDLYAGQTRVQEAYQRYQQTGDKRDMERYVKARLGQVVTDEHLNS